MPKQSTPRPPPPPPPAPDSAFDSVTHARTTKGGGDVLYGENPLHTAPDNTSLKKGIETK